jgi:hypothetical protein
MSITELEILLEETDSLITQMTISDDNVEMGDLLTQYCDLWDKIYDFAKANPDFKDSEEFTKMEHTYQYIYLSITGKVNIDDFEWREYYY